MDKTGKSPKRRIAVNLWLLDNMDVSALPVETLDGRNQW